MQPGTLARAGSVVLLVGLGAVGLYAYLQHREATTQRQQNTDNASQLEECKKVRDDEKKGRTDCEKTAADNLINLQSARTELGDLRHQKEEADKRAELFKSVTEKFRKLIDSGQLQVVMRNGRMVVKLPAGVLFSSGSAELSKGGQQALTEVAHILKQFPDRRFEVAGHTDNIPIAPVPNATPPKGGDAAGFKSNLELSAARAVTVTQHLISQGMNASRLAAAGYAEWQPVASNAKEQGRAENRRIEIVLLPDLTGLSELADGGI